MLTLLNQKDEYLHVLVNTFPTHGLFIGIISLLLAVFSCSRSAKVIALVIIMLCSLSAWPTHETGEGAYDTVYGNTDELGEAWLDHHAYRAEKVLPLFFIVAALAAAAIALPLKFPRSESTLITLTLLLSIAAVVAGSWVSFAGGKVSHREFRTDPPPTPLPKSSHNISTGDK